MIVLGLHRYVPDNPLPGVIYMRDAEGRDWYDLRDSFDPTTMKYAFDDNHYLIAFSPTITFFPPIGTISECPRSAWPDAVTLNRIWYADESGVRCRISDLPYRMGQCANAFTSVAYSYPGTTEVLATWRKQPGWPYVPFPQFGMEQVETVVRLTTLTLDEYHRLSRP